MSRKGTAPETEGQRLLVELKASLAEVAAAVGCSKALAGFWRTGAKVPSDVMRAKIEAVYAIPRSSWDVAAGGPGRPPSGEQDLDDEGDDEPDDLATADTLELANERLRSLRRRLRRKDLSETARAKTEEVYQRQLALRARAERDIELSLHAFAKSAQWKTAVETIREALRPFPDARRAVAKALTELEL